MKENNRSQKQNSVRLEGEGLGRSPRVVTRVQGDREVSCWITSKQKIIDCILYDVNAAWIVVGGQIQSSARPRGYVTLCEQGR